MSNIDQLEIRQRALTLLGIKDASDLGALKEAYRIKVKNHHPDTHPNDLTATRSPAMITETYSFLLGKAKPNLLIDTSPITIEGANNFGTIQGTINGGFYDFVGYNSGENKI